MLRTSFLVKGRSVTRRLKWRLHEKLAWVTVAVESDDPANVTDALRRQKTVLEKRYTALNRSTRTQFLFRNLNNVNLKRKISADRALSITAFELALALATAKHHRWSSDSSRGEGCRVFKVQLKPPYSLVQRC